LRELIAVLQELLQAVDLKAKPQNATPMNDKIRAKHLELAAHVHIRQSTLHRVRNNQESRRQYALEDRARELGFKNVVIIDEDLWVSGTGRRERPGFGVQWRSPRGLSIGSLPACSQA
jgi:hypothetical protein